MQNNSLFWQARINITQCPQPFKPREIPESLVDSFQEPYEVRTFLYDSFGDNRPGSYGLELISGERLDVVFYTSAKTELEALELGTAWLSDLRHKFLGLDGLVEAKLVKLEDLVDSYENTLFEIKLPSSVLRDKINIIEKFTTAFYTNKKNKIHLFILWKKESHEKQQGIEPHPNTYFIRIFVKYHSKFADDKEFSKFKGILKYLFMDIEEIHSHRAFANIHPEVSLLDIIKCDVFNNKDLNFVSKLSVNFDFPETLPLPRIPILETENVRYIDVNYEFKKKAIKLGIHIKNGVITDHTTYIPINKLPQDMDIFGKSGSGKTYFLARFIQELCKKADNFGILVLNVAKQSQEIYYNDFKKIRYSDDIFQISYFIEAEIDSREKQLQETATYICASLGLKNVFEKIVYRTMIGFLNLDGKLPEDFYFLLTGVENYMNSNPYGPEEQSNLMQAFRNRMNTFDEDKIRNVLKLNNKLPNWINEWLNGERLFLDLSMCSKFVKLLIVNVILQAIRTLTKDIEAETLKNLIVIDEAHAILEKPITTNSDDADFIMKEQMAKIFSELLKEYRSRGVGFIIADQSPSRLFDEVVSLPSIKVIFRQDYPDNLLFSEDPKERQILTQLENRFAIIINGATGEKYLMKTRDYLLNK